MNEFLFHSAEILLTDLIVRKPFGGMHEDDSFSTSRTFFRIFMGLFNVAAIVGISILWRQVPWNQRIEFFLWALAVILLAFLSLTVLIRNKEGGFWALPFIGVLWLAAGIEVFASGLKAHSGDPGFIYGLAGCFALPLVFFILSFIGLWLDPLPLASAWLRLGYPLRYKHLKAIPAFAQSKGWKVTGLEGPEHRLRTEFVWCGYPGFLVSERWYGRIPRGMRRNSIILGMRVENIGSSLYIGPRGEEIESSKVLEAVKSKPQFLSRLAEIRTYADECLIYHTFNLKFFQDPGKIQDVLQWLTIIACLLEVNKDKVRG